MNRKHQLISLLLSSICSASSTPQKRLLSDKSNPPQPVSANTGTVTPSPLATAQSNTQGLFIVLHGLSLPYHSTGSQDIAAMTLSSLFNALVFPGKSSRVRFMARAVRLSAIPH
jgi:hypothetical protein